MLGRSSGGLRALVLFYRIGERLNLSGLCADRKSSPEQESQIPGRLTCRLGNLPLTSSKETRDASEIEWLKNFVENRWILLESRGLDRMEKTL